MKTPRAEKAGEAMADAIIENVHLMYQKNTALNYLHSLVAKLKRELARRMNEKESTP